MKNIVIAGWIIIAFACASNAQEKVFELGDVSITDSRLEQLPVTSQSVVMGAEIRAFGARTADQALQMIPGVYILNPDKNARQINIRGFSGRELKVLVDGIPANETYLRTVDLSQIPSAGISAIKVVKGIPSVLYGANSMGGVVNIITKQGGEEPSASAEALFSDYSTAHVALNGGGQLGKFNVFLTYGYQSSDGYSVSDDFDRADPDVGEDSSFHEDGGLRDNSDYLKQSLTGKIGYDEGDSKVYLSFDWHDNELGIPTEYNRYWRFTEWKQWHLNLVGEQKVGPVTLTGRAFYFEHDDTLLNDPERTEALGGRNWFDESTYDDYSAGAMLRADWDFTEYSVFRAQVNYQLEQSRQRELNTRAGDGSIPVPGWSGDAVYETETWDFALENEWALEKLLAVVGLSYDLYRPLRSTGVTPGDDIDALNPQLGLRYSLTENAEIYGGIGRKTRFPHMKELYTIHSGGNPDLDPEYSDSIDVGAEMRLPGEMPLTIRVAAFNNEVHDLILSVERDGEDPRYENIGRSFTRGVELGFEIEPLESLMVGLNYTWLDARDEDLDRRLPSLPRHRINGEVRWMPLKGSSLFTQVLYAEDAQEYVFNRMTRSESTRQQPDYLLWNIGLEQQIFDYATLIVRVDNVLDEDYDIGDGPMPGRQAWAGCRVNW